MNVSQEDGWGIYSYVVTTRLELVDMDDERLEEEREEEDDNDEEDLNRLRQF